MRIGNAARHAIVIGVLTVCGAAPADAGTLPVTLIAHWDGFGGTYADVWGDGNFAYIGHFGHDAVNIINFSDPDNLVPGAYLLPPPNQGASAQDVKVGDGLMFIGMEGGSQSVEIVDVRDPMNPLHVGAIDIPGYRSIHNVFYDGGWLYMADSGSTRVGIVDLRTFDPDNPPASPISSAAWIIENVGISMVHDITVTGGRLYASAWDSGLWIYDVTNVATEMPTFLGSAPGENTHSCWPTDAGDYVVTGEERSGGGILVWRITDNGGSVTLDLTDELALSTKEASSVHNQAIVGYRLYNSWYGAGLRVHDIDPVTGLLTEVAIYDVGGAVWGVYPFLGPGRVLLSNMNSGLYIVSVGDSPLGDLDGDGLVGITDFLILLAEWGPCDLPCPPQCAADLDNDCNVGINDFLLLLANWS